MSKRIRFQITTDLIQQMLHLPDGVEIIAAEVQRPRGYEMLELTLAGPDFPDVPEGMSAPMADPIVTTHHVEGNPHADGYEWDWGIPAANAAT